MSKLKLHQAISVVLLDKRERTAKTEEIAS